MVRAVCVQEELIHPQQVRLRVPHARHQECILFQVRNLHLTVNFAPLDCIMITALTYVPNALWVCILKTMFVSGVKKDLQLPEVRRLQPHVYQ